MAGECVKVLLVGGQKLALQGLRSILEPEEDLEVVGETTCVEQALEEAAAHFPDIVLMDVKKPDYDVLEAIRQIKTTGLAGEVIVLSLYDGYLVQAIEAGARGYLGKETNREQLVRAIRQVHAGEVVLDRGLLASPILVKAIIRRFQEVARERTASIPEQSTITETSPILASLACSGEPYDLVKVHHPHPVNGLAEQQAAMLSEVALTRTTPVPEMLPTSTVDAVNRTVKHAVVAELTYGAPPEMAQHPGVLEKEVSEENQEDVTSAVDNTLEFNEEIELLIPPPVDASRLLLVFKRLREQHHMEVLHTVGSWEGGTWMRLRLKSSIDPMEVLAQMPEVAQVWETGPDSKRFLSRTVPLPCDITEPNARRHFFLTFANGASQLALQI